MGNKGMRWSKFKSPAARNLYNKLRNRGLVLDYEKFLTLTSSNCFYCNAPPKNERKVKNYPPYIYSGLDRKDPAGGYVEENIVPCCWKCNKMKSNMTTEQFIEYIRAILLKLSKNGGPNTY